MAIDQAPSPSQRQRRCSELAEAAESTGIRSTAMVRRHCCLDVEQEQARTMDGQAETLVEELHAKCCAKASATSSANERVVAVDEEAAMAAEQADIGAKGTVAAVAAAAAVEQLMRVQWSFGSMARDETRATADLAGRTVKGLVCILPMRRGTRSEVEPRAVAPNVHLLGVPTAVADSTPAH